MKSTTLKKLALESAAVLAGILMAFGIDASWDARSDAERESAYVDALRTEVLSNRLTVEAQLDFLADQGPLIRGFYASVVTTDTPVPDDQILTMMEHMGPLGLILERAALTDLLSSGGLAYLDSSELRRAIANYEHRLNHVVSSRASLQRYFEAEILPYYAAHASLSAVYNRLTGVFDDYGFPEGDFPIDTSAFVGNRMFANLFSTYLWHVEVIGNVESRFVESVGELEALLAG